MILNRTLNPASCAFFVGSPSQRGLPALRELFGLNAMSSYLPHFALHKMALVLLIPSLCCQKVPGPSSSRHRGSVCLPCTSSVVWHLCLPEDQKQTHLKVSANLDRAQNIHVIYGGKNVLPSPCARSGPGSLFGYLEGGQR